MIQYHAGFNLVLVTNAENIFVLVPTHCTKFYLLKWTQIANHKHVQKYVSFIQNISRGPNYMPLLKYFDKNYIVQIFLSSHQRLLKLLNRFQNLEFSRLMILFTDLPEVRFVGVFINMEMR